jgi:hypothetical protein
MLHLESRELRNQAKGLRKQLAEATAHDRENWSGVQNFVKFVGSSRAG